MDQSLPEPGRRRRLTPAAFRHPLLETSRRAGARIVLPEGVEPRTVRAVVACAERGIARPVLLARPDEMRGGPTLARAPAAMILEAGEVDRLVTGAAHTTAAAVRPAVELIRAAPGARLVSSAFFMCLPDEVVVYGDCAINPDPSATELADIAVRSATSAAALASNRASR